MTVFLVFTQSQETQKTIDIAAIFVFQTKEIIKILLLRVRQHGRHDVRLKSAIKSAVLKMAESSIIVSLLKYKPLDM